MRLLVVSNRLPITVAEKGGKLKFEPSAGGLVSGLSSYLDALKSSSLSESSHIWVGWPGVTVSDKAKTKVQSRLLSDLQAFPVFLSERDMDAFYFGFCNRTIWPLFHYFPARTVFITEYWDSYKRINQVFCDRIMELLQPDDVVWINDYHLMLLPRLLRERAADASIGFFLHIPFPSFEVFRLLPRQWREEILEGLLGADLIGFHTHDYAQYFLRCVLRVLGHEHKMGQIVAHGGVIKVDTFPMGINFERFHSAGSSPEVQTGREEMLNSLRDFKVILSIDRLDYTKGILNRLQGYEIFLERNPHWHGKVVLVTVVVPSRIGVEHYQRMKRQIDELIGKINGRFGSIHWTPILYQYRFLPFNALVALYSVSDVALVTPLRDGMNLIAKEYIATRQEKGGVLILSEMAGAAKELGEAIVINPNNVDEICDAIKEALQIAPEEQVRRNRVMQRRLKSYDVVRWANDFVDALFRVKAEQEKLNSGWINPVIAGKLIEDFAMSRQRLLLLDYDGTLVPFVEDPHDAAPNHQLLGILRGLLERSETDVVLISGRDKGTLQAWFGMLPLVLVAEHGAWIKEREGNWVMLKPLSNEWKAEIRPLIQAHADRLPGSFVEEKEFSIAWHYRMADPELGPARAKELIDDLVHFTANIDVQVWQGNKIVELRNAGVNKGTAATRLLSKGSFDFILAMGDDWADEELFRALPKTAYTIRIGVSRFSARFNLHNPSEALELLEKLTTPRPIR